MILLDNILKVLHHTKNHSDGASVDFRGNLPLISIIIPVYNIEKYLPACLKSVLAQSYTNFEVICVNDGSTDACANILKDFKNKDNRVTIITQTNQGVSVARNNGLQKARGEYISFIDSDDEIDCKFLEKMVSVLKTDMDADFAWVDTQKGIERQQNILSSDPIHSYTNLFDHYLARKKPKILSSSVNKLYRRELLENIQFPPHMTVGEDLIFLHQVLYKSKKAVHIPEKLYFYRYHEESAVHRKLTKQRVDDEFLCTCTLSNLFKDKDMPEHTRKKFNQYIARRLLYNVVKLPKEKDKSNFRFWINNYLPYLEELETKGIFQTKYLSFKNRLIYQYYKSFQNKPPTVRLYL